MSEAGGLGPFRPLHPIGRGASGEVWRGVYAPDETPVALKFVSLRADPRETLEDFRREVRAVAGLDHPHIITILDHGVLADPLTARLGAGCPWLAMELAEGGSLQSWRSRLTWEELLTVLRNLLGALAHAHSRGVIHRDLKPGNVLVGGLRPGVKLTDFGLARLGGRLSAGEEVAGTPAYMAPEQFEGQGRALGPWTDLYALGCLGWALVSGEPPFGPQSMVEARTSHLHGTLPALERAVAVPAGLEGWLRRLLAREPGARFLRAADAAWALEGLRGPLLEPTLELPSPRELPPSGRPRRLGSGTGRSLSQSATLADSPATLFSALDDETLAWMRSVHVDPSAPVLAPSPLEERAPGHAPPPFPEEAGAPGEGQSPGWMELGAVGLQLFGLRVPPVAGRVAERARLWATLGEVVRGRRPRVVTLGGVAGVGKTRLAGWLCERAHEVGAASVLRVGHSPGGGPGDGLQGLLDREEGEDGPAPQTSGERMARVSRILRARSRERAVVLWVEDAAWGQESLLFATRLLERAGDEDQAVLVLLTARSEALVERPLEAAAMERLRRLDGAEHLELGPLSERELSSLVRALLGLQTDLTARVVQRSAGNPLFAVQMVAELVGRGLLVPGERGYELALGAEPTLPADLRAAWDERLARLLRGRAEPERDRIALELAATLGSRVDEALWVATCAELGLAAPWGLVEELLEARLVWADAAGPRAGWTFAQAMLRESALHGAELAGRVATLHRACAVVLSRASAPDRTLAERLGRHWLLAGEPELALAPLLEAARTRKEIGEYSASELLLRLRDGAQAALGITAPDPRWIHGELSWVTLLFFLGRTEEAVPRAEALMSITDAPGLEDEHVIAVVFWASILRLRGFLPDALAALEGIEAAARALPDSTSLFKLLRERARMCADLGQTEAAFAALREALTLPTPPTQREPEALAQLDLYRVLSRVGRLEEARACNEAAREVYVAGRHYWGMADCDNNRGEICRMAGDLDEADRWYRASLEGFRAIGAYDSHAPMMNLSFTSLLRGETEGVARMLDQLLRILRRRRAVRAEWVVLAMQLALAGTLEDWEGWDQRWAELRAAVPSGATMDPDYGEVLELAARRAEAHGQPARALDALLHAAESWRAIGADERAQGAEAWASRLTPARAAGPHPDGPP